MDNEKIIKVIDSQGKEREAEIVLCFEKDGKNYIIYTFNEKDSKGMVILYSSIIKFENGENILEKLSDAEWKMVKKVMNQVVLEGSES